VLPAEDGYFHELEHFVHAVESGRRSGIVTAQSSALAVKLCVEEMRSVRENREVSTLGLGASG
jgi:predicted alternative tryptophan synthase beta-subunit